MANKEALQHQFEATYWLTNSGEFGETINKITRTDSQPSRRMGEGESLPIDMRDIRFSIALIELVNEKLIISHQLLYFLHTCVGCKD